MNEHILTAVEPLSPRAERGIVIAIAVSILIHGLVLSLDAGRDEPVPEPLVAPTMKVRTVTQTEAPPPAAVQPTENASNVVPIDKPLPLESPPPVIDEAEPVPVLTPDWHRLGKAAAQQAARKQATIRPMNQLPETDFEVPRPKAARRPLLESYVSIYGDDMMRYGKHCFVRRPPSPFEGSTTPALMLVTRCPSDSR